MPQNLVRGTAGGSIGGTVNIAGWGGFSTLSSVLLEEDIRQVFQPATQSRKIYLLNEGPGEIQISFGSSFNPDSPLFLSPGHLFEEESEEALWGKGVASLKRMVRFRVSSDSNSNPNPEPPPPAPSLTILSEGKAFVPTGAELNLMITALSEFRGYNTEWLSFHVYRAEALENLNNPRDDGIFVGEFFLEPPDFTSVFQINQPGNFYCVQAWLDFLQVDEIAFLNFSESTNTLTLS